MGYSCTVKASQSLDAIMSIIGEPNRSNVFRNHFYEMGRENDDGSITAQVLRFIGDNRAKISGSIRIEPDGKITRFPTSTKSERARAEKLAADKYNSLYSRI